MNDHFTRMNSRFERASRFAMQLVSSEGRYRYGFHAQIAASVITANLFVGTIDVTFAFEYAHAKLADGQTGR
jgi:hypothetical protein